VIVHLQEHGQQANLFEGNEDMATDYRDHLHAACKLCEDAGDMETAKKIHGLMTPAKSGDDEDLEEDAMEDESLERPAGYKGGTAGRATTESRRGNSRYVGSWKQLQESIKRRPAAKTKGEFLTRLLRG
jgi:hypothetical protein